MAENAPELFTTEEPQIDHVAEGAPEAGHTEQHDGGHAEGPMFIFGPGGWVGLSMLVFLLILGWKGVHKLIAGGLDSKIAAIREQLDEAKSLRAEAEALRAEYTTKIANAEKDAEAMLANARNEAEAIVAKAEADTKAMIARRQQMAKDKISAEERKAIDELRARAAEASTAAAARIIAEKHDAEADSKLADATIAGL